MGRTLGKPVDLGFEQYAGLVQQRVHPTNCCMSDKPDELLMAVLQQHEQSSPVAVLWWGLEGMGEGGGGGGGWTPPKLALPHPLVLCLHNTKFH